ncbi:MAG: MFS transporter [Buchnera aphidicola (Aphis urticata)]|uniref:MFS transporter n=1 Tax=Buchnera aphidicola (Aphis urticata) TaxID=2708353 RepID=A0AAJ4KUZ9_9GAMM|nr:MAG: MFS transporter [Buchnera aphidicola (Aphis urticata)]
MNFFELQVTLSFCIIFLLRMLGVFGILPVLSKYGLDLDDGNKFLIGLSVSVYAFAQMIFQIPFGMLSDKFGRKKIIIFGLCVFLIGSIIAANTNSIWGLIVGRAIQGSGAISGVSIALLSDLIRKENRIKSIAAIGASFAISFLISILFGTLVIDKFGFSFIFWFSSIFSIICILIIFFIVPSYTNQNYQEKTLKKDIKFFYSKNIKYLFNISFCRFYFSIFCLHFLLTMHFLIIPHQLESAGLILNYHWIIYLTTILISFCILYWIVFYAKFNVYLKNIIEICVFLIFLSSLFLFFLYNYVMYLILSLQLFFIAFNILEVFLPSFLSQHISINNYQGNIYKGSIMSIYSTSQYLGISFGGIINGWLYTFLNISHIFLFEVFLVFIWFIFNCFCRK